MLPLRDSSVMPMPYARDTREAFARLSQAGGVPEPMASTADRRADSL